MPTRLRRPSIWRQLPLTVGLLAFQGYLGYSVVTGQFGIERQDVLDGDLKSLGAQSAALQAEIDSYRHRVSLFDADKMDPDIVSERARALLSMSSPEDVVIMVDPRSGKPISSSVGDLPQNQLNATIERGID
jgi:cell division protein FtsB